MTCENCVDDPNKTVHFYSMPKQFIAIRMEPSTRPQLEQLMERRKPHRATLKSRNADGQTTLSNYVWDQKDKKMNPEILLTFLDFN